MNVCLTTLLNKIGVTDKYLWNRKYYWILRWTDIFIHVWILELFSHLGKKGGRNDLLIKDLETLKLQIPPVLQNQSISLTKGRNKAVQNIVVLEEKQQEKCQSYQKIICHQTALKASINWGEMLTLLKLLGLFLLALSWFCLIKWGWVHGGGCHSADISYFSQVALRPGRPSREDQGIVVNSEVCEFLKCITQARCWSLDCMYHCCASISLYIVILQFPHEVLWFLMYTRA